MVVILNHNLKMFLRYVWAPAMNADIIYMYDNNFIRSADQAPLTNFNYDCFFASLCLVSAYAFNVLFFVLLLLPIVCFCLVLIVFCQERIRKLKNEHLKHNNVIKIITV